uniref:Uncharacterized protein n=1 Tax=Lygus hesperus TaxID=30085 RepID=A0A0K8SBZ3_LYGHE
MEDGVDWKQTNILRKFVKRFIPRSHSFLFCISLGPGCALIGLLSIILPIIDIVQIGLYLYYLPDEYSQTKCPNQWYLETSPISSYAIFSVWPLVLLHFAFAVIYFLLSLALIVGVAWRLEWVIFSVLIGAIIVYIPSFAIYLLEILTSFKSSWNKVATWIFIFSPLIWLYFMSVIHGYVHNLELLRLIRKGILVKPDVYAKWGPPPKE